MTKLFEPLKVGPVTLGHRVVMAPLTRYRCDDQWTPTAITREYYEQRACVPGTLIINEATLVSQRAISNRNVPGLWSESQIAAWKEIADSVHAKGCMLACQLWHQGRAGDPEILKAEGCQLWSSSATPVTPNDPVPVAMPEDEIWRTIDDYATTAKNAIAAGFDLVEIHGANGYLPDQFLQDTCNKRTDEWGGSIENRTRFLFEVTKAIATAIGPERVGVRLSPYSDFLGMLMEDPDPTFKRMVERLKPLGLGYLHLIEARIRGNDDADCGGQKTVKWLVELWDNATPVFLSGGFTAESAKTAVDQTYANYDVCIVFGRYFVSNPDLVFRIKSGVPLTKYERTYFYTPKLVKGYTDYPFSKEYLAQA
ncbi:NADPH2 dehydrogenase [Capronia coronata CBS 617.96]|uniref:NADPH2 dehydrogenase n=1 Tax=Capronia coronata CBS 617.96 TaxID=1182541 RepID=W9YVH9_9EURO|nr:NADPH2 dehydrogenase [Capronia coronata CBS 617.96]EXJ96518.1 NADPH2 dehydrogenase [Capronia coronata CBS 617.96]